MTYRQGAHNWKVAAQLEVPLQVQKSVSNTGKVGEPQRRLRGRMSSVDEGGPAQKQRRTTAGTVESHAEMR